MKNSVIFSVMDISIATNQPIRVALAAPVKRQAANAIRNLPPKSPSRGPVVLITRQTPNSSNLKKNKNEYLIALVFKNFLLYSAIYCTLSLQMKKRIWKMHKT